MMITKKMCMTFMIFLMTLSLSAQQAGRNDRIESLKVAFITKKLDLSPEESADFWPLYNEMESKVEDIRKQQLGKARNVKSEDEARAFVLQRLENEEEVLSLKKNYYLKLMDAIGAQKVVRLNQVENQFKRELLKEVRNRRSGGKSR